MIKQLTNKIAELQQLGIIIKQLNIRRGLFEKLVINRQLWCKTTTEGTTTKFNWHFKDSKDEPVKTGDGLSVLKRIDILKHYDGLQSGDYVGEFFGIELYKV